MKKLVRRYLKLIKKIPERHYWPLFIFLSLYFVVPYSEFVVTIFLLGYFKFEQQYRKVFGKIVAPLPDIIKYGASVIFFLVMLDDTLSTVLLFLLHCGLEEKQRESKRSDPLFGVIAQLVERLLCKQDVSGSSPLNSINT